jgi:hypothetical protein
MLLGGMLSLNRLVPRLRIGRPARIRRRAWCQAARYSTSLDKDSGFRQKQVIGFDFMPHGTLRIASTGSRIAFGFII